MNVILGKNHFNDQIITNINLGALMTLFMKFNPKVSITQTSVKSEWILFYQGLVSINGLDLSQGILCGGKKVTSHAIHRCTLNQRQPILYNT